MVAEYALGCSALAVPEQRVAWEHFKRREPTSRSGGAMLRSRVLLVMALAGVAGLALGVWRCSDGRGGRAPTRDRVWAAMNADGTLDPARALALAEGAERMRTVWRGGWIRLVDTDHFIDQETRRLRRINRDGSMAHPAVPLAAPLDCLFLLGGKPVRTVESPGQFHSFGAWLVVSTETHLWCLHIMSGDVIRVVRKS